MWFGAVSLGLAAALSLAAAWCFVRAWRDPAARVGWAAVACYAAALLAHESAVALPLVFGTLAMFESRRPGQGLPRPVPPWLWAGVAVLVAHLGLLAWAYRVRAATYPDNGYRFLGFGGDLFVAPARYAAQLVVPPPMTEPLALGEAGPWLGLAAVLGAAWWAWRGDRWVRLGLAWLALAALPYVLFGVYGVADRYYYFPSVGLALVVASVLMRRGRWGTTVLALYAMASMLLLGQAADEWRAAGATARATMDTLGRWAGGSAEGASAEAALFVGVPFKQSTRWPGSQVYVFSTGIVGAAHLATGWPRLQVSYVFGDEQPTLGRRLAALSPTGGPPGLYLFDLGVEPVADLSGVVGAALPELAALHWHGASRTPVDWQRYVGQPVPWDRSESVAARGGEPPGGPMAPGGP